MLINHYDLSDYEFEPRTYEALTFHQQEIFITQYATAPQLEQIVKIDKNSATYAMVAERGEVGPNRILARARLTFPSTLAYIYKHTSDPLTTRGLASNWNTPEFILSDLVKPTFGDKLTRIYAWRNPSLSPDDRTPENDPMGRD